MKCHHETEVKQLPEKHETSKEEKRSYDQKFTQYQPPPDSEPEFSENMSDEIVDDEFSDNRGLNL
jgi:hypothetical protein